MCVFFLFLKFFFAARWFSALKNLINYIQTISQAAYLNLRSIGFLGSYNFTKINYYHLKLYIVGDSMCDNT